MSESATDRVRACLAAGQAPTRKDIEHSMREAWGLSARKARALAAALTPVLGAVDDGADELRERLERLERALRM